MHDSAMNFLREVIEGRDVRGKTVLEVGSFDVNGSPRTVIEPFRPLTYTGVDMRMGPSVDFQINSDNLLHHFESESFDLVISTEMLEHCENWRLAVLNMKQLVKHQGILIVTCRGPGFPYHPEVTEEGAYGDYWRFTTNDFARIFSDFETLELREDSMPGVLYKGRRVGPLTTDLSSIEVRKIS